MTPNTPFITSTGARATEQALLIVDVQNDFCEGGALGVPGGNSVATGLARYLHEHPKNYDLVVTSQDWHSAQGDNGGHFALDAPPNFTTTWPIHCVENTEGAALHPSLAELGQELPLISVHKGTGKPAYSAFEGSDSEGRSLAKLLRAHNVSRLDITGIATDFCVQASALDALKEGFSTTVLTDFTAGIDPESTQAALENLREAGATVT